ncbi:YheC/YheD family protein [Cohnella soli]|uniref:YheC/YheD family protein n=1 Tax=Cohnella soli TaxID=425005 RepID=A0ABW0HQW7_9BACL
MNSKNGLVGILVANQRQRKYALSQFLSHNAAGMKLISFTPSSIDWKQRTVIGLHRVKGKWAVGRFPLPQVVYNRCYGTEPKQIERLDAAIGGGKCFNKINQLNKLDIYNVLNRWLTDYLPETVLYDPENALNLLERYKVVYFKPFYGNMGRKVYRAEINSAGEILIGHHYFSPKTIAKNLDSFHEKVGQLLGSTSSIVQRGIPIQQTNGQVFDIRSLVQKNEKGLWSVTNLVSRIAYKGSYNTSIFVKVCQSEEVLKQLYPAAKVKEIMTSIYDISLRSAEIIDMSTDYHLGEFSVDVALDNDSHPWIIELNGKPQKELYKEIANRSVVYQRPIQYARYLYGKQPL